MPEHVVEAATVDPRPTAVVAQATTWEEYAGLWPRLLDEVYAFVRPRPALGGPGPGPRWENVMLYKDDAPNVEVGVLVAASFARGARRRLAAARRPRRADGPPRRLRRPRGR